MQNGPKTMMNTHRPKSARPFASRSKQRTSSVARPAPRGSQNAQRSYEQYLALAQGQAQTRGIRIATTMSTDRIKDGAWAKLPIHRRN
jgi:hypothetical protein